ncbi:MAG: protein-export chaperone SecB [Alphaproteobacteria bacterium]|nr:protein-export chaperone SecB [Alphaproteobacteria bacterium]
MTENTKKQPEEQPLTLQINTQYIKDLSFEAPGMPNSMLSLSQPPEVQISVDVNASKLDDKDHFTVDLHIKVQADKKEDHKSLFLCDLLYGGLATLQAPESHIEPLLLIEIPHLLFPYARAIIGNLIREAGFPPLQINPIDFAALYRARLAQKHQEKGEKK